MSILIIHHLETIWNDGYKRIGNTNFDALQERVAEFIESKDYSRVILTRFEDHCIDHCEYWAIAHLIDEVQVYAYGWEAEFVAREDEETGEQDDVLEIISERGEYVDQYGQTWCEGGNHSQVVLVEDWIKRLPKDGSVDICGAFLGECLEDLDIALTHAKVQFNYIDELCI